jgi:hypothetical protein
MLGYLMFIGMEKFIPNDMYEYYSIMSILLLLGVFLIKTIYKILYMVFSK